MNTIMRKKRLGLIPLSFLAFVLLHIAILGMPESAAEEFGAGTQPVVPEDGNYGSHDTGCPVDMMIILVRDTIVKNT